MKAVLRRLAQLEGRSIPKVDGRMRELAAVLRERRRRRLQAASQPFEEEVQPHESAVAGPHLSLAETFRLRRQQRSAG
jgi:hypothetical protein